MLYYRPPKYIHFLNIEDINKKYEFLNTLQLYANCKLIKPNKTEQKNQWKKLPFMLTDDDHTYLNKFKLPRFCPQSIKIAQFLNLPKVFAHQEPDDAIDTVS